MPGLYAENREYVLLLEMFESIYSGEHELTCEPLVQVSPTDRQWESIQGYTCQDQI